MSKLSIIATIIFKQKDYLCITQKKIKTALLDFLWTFFYFGIKFIVNGMNKLKMTKTMTCEI